MQGCLLVVWFSTSLPQTPCFSRKLSLEDHALQQASFEVIVESQEASVHKDSNHVHAMGVHVPYLVGSG